MEKVPAAFEMFTAITYNSSMLQPSFTVSLEGGVDIEEVPENKKLTIPVDIFRGLDAYQASEVLEKLGGKKILPILFGGGASTVFTETLEIAGGNPPYERMRRINTDTAETF